jgi:hypothetical protein
MVDKGKFGEAQPLKEGSSVCRYCYCEVKQWVGLTDEELRQCIGIGTEDSDWNVAIVQEWLRKVEAKLKAKNNG